MGKFISKIAPTINSGEALKATNQKVPRKVLYRRLQSSRPYDEREFVPFTDFVRQCSGFIIMGMLMYILHKRGALVDMLPDDHDKPWQLQQNMYEKIRGGYFNQQEDVKKDNSSE